MKLRPPELESEPELQRSVELEWYINSHWKETITDTGNTNGPCRRLTGSTEL